MDQGFGKIVPQVLNAMDEFRGIIQIHHMKKHFLSLGLMLLSGAVMAQYPTTGLVAYFPLDGNGNDAGPNSITPVSVNAVAATDRNNAANGAYYFSTAENHFIEYSLTAFPELQVASDMTIAFYAKLEDHFSGTTLPTAVAISDKVRTGMNVVGTFPSISVRAGFERYSDGTNASLVSGMLGNSSVTAAWAHYAFVKEGGSLTIYRNGAVLSTSSPANVATDIAFGVNDLVMRIGQSADGDAQKKYRGTIDDVFIYSRALTVGEVTDLFEFNSVPTFLIQPLSQEFPCATGQLVQLTVDAVNAASVQWQLDGQDIPNATSEYHSFNLDQTNVGDYTCVITGYDGSTETSDVATISLEEIALAYDPVTYTISASHPTYTRWRLFLDGNQIATQNNGNLSYVIDQSGEYYAIFDDGCGLGNIITTRNSFTQDNCSHSVSVPGGTPPLSAQQAGAFYNSAGTSFNANQNYTCGNTITMSIVDGNGCADSYTYNNNTAYNSPIVRTPNPRCAPQTNTLNITLVYNENASDVICVGTDYNIGNQTFTDGGVYTVNLTSVNGADSIVTLTLTEAQPVVANASDILCVGDSYIFGTQTITTTGDFVETFVAANGCDSTVTLTLTAPEAELTFDPQTNTLTGSSDLSGWVLTHNGNFMGQASGNTLNVPGISMSGTYEVTFGSPDCGLGTVTLTQSADNVTVNVPSATPPIAANISWPNNPNGVNSIWQINGNTYPGMGVSAYTLVMTDANGCTETLNFSVNLSPNPSVFTSSLPTAPCQTTASVEVTLVPVGISEGDKNGLAIYPNPFNSEFIIETTELTAVSVMNAMGEVVLSRTVNGRTSIDATNLSAGVYFVREETSGAVMKLVKN